jgi:hypothetical protein
MEKTGRKPISAQEAFLKVKKIQSCLIFQFSGRIDSLRIANHCPADGDPSPTPTVLNASGLSIERYHPAVMHILLSALTG